MRRTPSSIFLAILLFCCASACLPVLNAQAPPDYRSNPKFISAIAEAKKLTHERQYDFAIDAYKKASKIAAGKDANCLETMYSLQLKIGTYKDAAATAAALEAIATNPADKSYAE